MTVRPAFHLNPPPPSSSGAPNYQPLPSAEEKSENPQPPQQPQAALQLAPSSQPQQAQAQAQAQEQQQPQQSFIPQRWSAPSRSFAALDGSSGSPSTNSDEEAESHGDRLSPRSPSPVVLHNELQSKPSAPPAPPSLSPRVSLSHCDDQPSLPPPPSRDDETSDVKEHSLPHEEERSEVDDDDLKMDSFSLANVRLLGVRARRLGEKLSKEIANRMKRASHTTQSSMKEAAEFLGEKFQKALAKGYHRRWFVQLGIACLFLAACAFALRRVFPAVALGTLIAELFAVSAVREASGPLQSSRVQRLVSSIVSSEEVKPDVSAFDASASSASSVSSALIPSSLPSSSSSAGSPTPTPTASAVDAVSAVNVDSSSSNIPIEFHSAPIIPVPVQAVATGPHDIPVEIIPPPPPHPPPSSSSLPFPSFRHRGEDLLDSFVARLSRLF